MALSNTADFHLTIKAVQCFWWKVSITFLAKQNCTFILKYHFVVGSVAQGNEKQWSIFKVLLKGLAYSSSAGQSKTKLNGIVSISQMGKMRQQSKGLNSVCMCVMVIPCLDVHIGVSGNPSFCICIWLQGKHFAAFYPCSTWDHYICNSLCSMSAPIGLNIREVSPQVGMNLWPFAKHTEILLLRIITELTSLQGEEEITGANSFAKP